MIAYNDKKIEGKTKLSPSLFATFYSNPEAWYKKAILKEGNFKGNTNTVVGTIIHKRIENYFNDEPTNAEEEFDYIETYKDNVEVDEWKVADEVNRLWEMLQIELPHMPKPTSQEQAVEFHIPNSDYYIFGTYDYTRKEDDGLVLGDIKTTSVTPKKIKFGHRVQMLLYALAMDEKPTKMEVTYIVKLKKKPTMVVITEPVEERDLQWMKDEVKKLVKRCELAKNDDELRELLFYRNPDSWVD